jgi:thiol-disulfide isomerase/thioredoxin
VKRRERRRLPLVGIMVSVVAVLLAGALIYNAVRKDDGGPSNASISQTHSVSVEGSALPQYDSTAASDPAVGMAAPVLHGQDFTGKAQSVGGKTGKPSLVMFVAHWCPHCQREVPPVVGWRADGTIPPDIDLVAISTAADPALDNYPPSEWLAREQWPGRVMTDDRASNASLAYGLPSYPFFVALDKEGRVVGRGSGELDQAAIEQLVSALEQG